MENKINNESRSIIFVVSDTIKVYIGPDVKLNNNSKLENFKIIFEGLKGSYNYSKEMFLKLKDDLHKSTTAYLAITPEASFTDTRVIYVWLKSWQEINKIQGQTKQFWISKNWLKTKIVSIDSIQSINWDQNLVYSNSPRINN